MEEKKVNWTNLYLGLMGLLVLQIGLFYWLMKAFS